jgi:uncharacterized protein YndB with AHSA1/START domain
MTPIKHELDPKLDLYFERIVDIPPDLVWAAWTRPEHIVHWFTPAPWKTVACEIDLRPGGRFFTMMQSPEGQDFPNEGCYLEIVENRKLAWTNALLPGFRPAGAPAEGGKECNEILFAAVITLEPHGHGTRYTALAIHRDEEGRKKHEAMGFEHGWGAALDQLVAHMRKR